MLCSRCRHYAATRPDGLCSNCPHAPVPPGADPAAQQPGAVLPVAPPLGVAPMAPPVGGAGSLRSPVGLGKAAAILLGVVIAADLFAIGVDVNMYEVAGSIADGAFGASADRKADRADMLNGMAGSIQVTMMLATMVVFLVWFHRVRVNAEVFAADRHSKARGWAVWGWFE